MSKLFTISKCNNFISAVVNTVSCGEKSYFLNRLSPDESPIQFCTATSTMKDFIGNIIGLHGDKCSARGIINGHDQIVNNVDIIDGTKTIGERIMLTEHINTCGTFELLASKKRILLGDINFINIGWRKGNHKRFMRIDPYTGNSKVIED